MVDDDYGRVWIGEFNNRDVRGMKREGEEGFDIGGGYVGEGGFNNRDVKSGGKYGKYGGRDDRFYYI